MNYLLAPLAGVFWLISRTRNFLYDQGFFKSRKLDVPIICIGNLTTGGTGKTPWVQWVSDWLYQSDREVAIVSRGYSGDFSGVLKVTDGMDPRQCGDEPLWLVKNTQARVYVGKNRFLAAQSLISEKRPDVILLDDGYQHRALKRDLNLVLLDASVPRSHYRMLPMGRMREGFSALNRADCVIINKCNFGDQEQIDRLHQQCLKHLAPEKIYFAEFVFDQWMPLITELKHELDESKVTVCCAVGNPGAFMKTLNEKQIQPVKDFIYPDHYYWKPEDIEKMTYHMQQAGSHDLVMTEKDAVKLVRYRKHFREMKIQLWICKMKISLGEREGDFSQFLSTKMQIFET